MTKKRFTFDIDNENGTDDPYFCNGIDSFYVDNVDEMELFIKEINELVEENNELKKQMNRLYNYFWDWHSDEMGGNQFSEMWDGVKESERWDEGW